VSKRLSLHAVVALILLGLGGIGLSLVLFSFGLYRDLAEQTRTDSLRELVELQVARVTDELAQGQRIVVLQLLRDEGFRGAWRAGDDDALAARLERLVGERRAELGGDALRGLRLLDADGAPRVAAGDATAAGCPQLHGDAGGGDRLPSTTTCLDDERASLSVLVPMTGLEPAGRVEVVSDPIARLRGIADAADTAVRVERPGGSVLYESRDWSTLVGRDALVASYLARTETGDPVFTVRAATDVGRLRGQIADTRNFVLLAAGTVLAAALLTALVTLRRQLAPLRDLQAAAEAVTPGRSGARDFEPVPIRGPIELATPIASFNRMFERIQSLVGSLEHEVDQRREAEQRAVEAARAAQNNAAAASREKEFWQITLESIVDAVIATDTRGAVTYLNPVAEELTALERARAIGAPVDDVARLLDADGTPRAGAMVARSLRGERVAWQDTLVLERAGHDNVLAECASVPTRDAAGGITGAVVVVHDVTEARRLTERLTFQATHDALTGLINRYEFDQRLRRAVEQARSDDATAVLCYLDLDQFKLVNDTCGHVAGDELLRQLALMLQDLVGSRGTLARLGGDEFGLLLQGTDVESARAVAEEMRDAIARFRFVWEDAVFGIGVSIGMIELDADSENTERVLAAADTACYLAKDSGRNRVQLYRPDDAVLAERHAEMRWVSEIHRALETDRFRLYGQDIIPAARHAEGPRHLEVLLRLLTEDGRTLLPGTFLTAAERYDLAPVIDRWVVDHTLDWMAAGGVTDATTLSVNLSGRSLAQDGFLDHVLAAFERTGVSGSNICFEITETAAISNLAHARAFMERLRTLGCRFSLDDFGSGLSSFAYLKNLPVDFLKIDGAFVRDIHRDLVHFAIVRSMNDVGHAMGMKTIAEFVSNADVTHCLVEIGVDYLQGFEYSQPQPLAGLVSQSPHPGPWDARVAQ